MTQVVSGGAGIEKLPRETVWAYTGLNTDDGSFNRDQAARSALTIVGGLIAAAAIGYGIKHM